MVNREAGDVRRERGRLNGIVFTLTSDFSENDAFFSGW